jgi:aspartyl-tRNA(Asn)/glutamyl-tRNA(Gln) amidotransferase subunit A
MAARTALSAEGLVFHDPHLRSHPELYGEELRRRLLANYFIPARDLARAHRARRLLKERFAAVFQQIDLLAAPTTPIVAFPLDATMAAVHDAKSGETVERPVAVLMMRLTSPGNVTGLPAISVPGGFTSAGLPIGFQLVARPFEEDLLLGAAYAYEQATRWHTRKPPYVSATVAV